MHSWWNAKICQPLPALFHFVVVDFVFCKKFEFIKHVAYLPLPPLCSALHLATKLILFVDIIVTYCVTKDEKGLQKDSFVFATLFFKKFDICKLCYRQGEREKNFWKFLKNIANILQEEIKENFAKGFF